MPDSRCRTMRPRISGGSWLSPLAAPRRACKPMPTAIRHRGRSCKEGSMGVSASGRGRPAPCAGLLSPSISSSVVSWVNVSPCPPPSPSLPPRSPRLSASSSVVSPCPPPSPSLPARLSNSTSTSLSWRAVAAVPPTTEVVPPPLAAAG